MKDLCVVCWRLNANKESCFPPKWKRHPGTYLDDAEHLEWNWSEWIVWTAWKSEFWAKTGIIFVYCNLSGLQSTHKSFLSLINCTNNGQKLNADDVLSARKNDNKTCDSSWWLFRTRHEMTSSAIKRCQGMKIE